MKLAIFLMNEHAWGKKWAELMIYGHSNSAEGMHSLIILWKKNWMYQITPEGLESLEHEYSEMGSEKKAVKKKERKNVMLVRY